MFQSRRLLGYLLVVCTLCAVSRLVYAFGVPPTPKRKDSPTPPGSGGRIVKPVKQRTPRAVSSSSPEPLLPATPGAESRNEKAGIDLVEIRAGWFNMGSPKGIGDADEYPRHKVYLDTYRIAKTEVTVSQFRKYCEASGYSYDWNGQKPSWGYVDDYPMVNVDWDEAKAYCAWAGGDLPTEAEWEKAAKGTDGRGYPWTGGWDAAKCVNGSNSGGHPASVGSKSGDRSPYGVEDMGGNVWEWCKDRYDSAYYSRSPKRNPQGNNNGTDRVLRGGSWLNVNPDDFRCALRYWYFPTSWYSNNGFRPVFH